MLVTNSSWIRPHLRAPGTLCSSAVVGLQLLDWMQMKNCRGVTMTSVISRRCPSIVYPVKTWFSLASVACQLHIPKCLLKLVFLRSLFCIPSGTLDNMWKGFRVTEDPWLTIMCTMYWSSATSHSRNKRGTSGVPSVKVNTLCEHPQPLHQFNNPLLYTGSGLVTWKLKSLLRIF